MRAPPRLPLVVLLAAFLALFSAACWPLISCGCVPPPAPVLSGAVVDEAGRGVPGVGLDLLAFRAGITASRTTTGAEGTFRVAGDFRERNYRLYVRPPAGYSVAEGQDNPVVVNTDTDSLGVVVQLVSDR